MIEIISTLETEVKDYYSHPKHEVVYVTFIAGIAVSAISDEICDCDCYDGYVLVDNEITKIEEDNFIPRGV